MGDPHESERRRRFGRLPRPLRWLWSGPTKPGDEEERGGAPERDGPDSADALVSRLQKLEWPRASEEVKERILREVFAQVETSEKAEAEAAARDDGAPRRKGATLGRRSRGSEERHQLTRVPPRHERPLLGHRRPLGDRARSDGSPFRLRERPMRQAVAL